MSASFGRRWSDTELDQHFRRHFARAAWEGLKEVNPTLASNIVQSRLSGENLLTWKVRMLKAFDETGVTSQTFKGALTMALEHAYSLTPHELAAEQVDAALRVGQEQMR